MTKPTLKQIRAAADTLKASDMTQSGFAKMDALNKALKDAGFDKTTAERRDLAVAGLDDAPEGQVKVTLNEAPMNPVPIYIHGLGHFSIRIGETKKLPKEAVEVLGLLVDTDFTADKE